MIRMVVRRLCFAESMKVDGRANKLISVLDNLILSYECGIFLNY
jgi:hypothetical protein